MSAIAMQEEERVSTHIRELDRVLGGGIVPGSLILVGGDPGIGKSTLLLQVCKYLSDDGRKVLYISGEESLRQIKLRAVRIGEFTDHLLLFCAVRYFVLHEMPFENDGVITWDLMVERMNSDLANTLGNLVNRTISMSNKYFGGLVENKKVGVDAGAEDVDADLFRVAADTYNRVSKKMDELRVADAITEIFVLFKRCNKYIDETMPWILAKEEAKKDRLATVLYNLLNGILVGASLLEPYMPETAARIAEQIKAEPVDFTVLEECAAKQDIEKISTLYPISNQVTQTPEILFARQDLKEVMEKVEAMFAARRAEVGGTDQAENEETPEDVIDIEAKDVIAYDVFDKCQFQVGEILECKEVPKSKKLLCSKVRVGSEVKQILSGIKQHYTAEEMVGKKVMVLVNLQPREIAGMMSEGMLLCAEDAEGKLSLMTPERPMPAGAEIC